MGHMTQALCILALVIPLIIVAIVISVGFAMLQIDDGADR